MFWKSNNLAIRLQYFHPVKHNLHLLGILNEKNLDTLSAFTNFALGKSKAPSGKGRKTFKS